MSTDMFTGKKYSSLNTTTQNKRKQLEVGMDDFCTFSWNGVDAWSTFGAFIINDKNSLKFYNGPQFSNTYAQPQYNTSALLEGVTFKTQQIKFKIGVYWIGDEDYRKFINWLNPYVVGTLVFDFNKQWGYRTKLANIQDSTRYVVGYELDEEGKSQRRYYTEMDLTFEVQGRPCAIATKAYEWENTVGTREESIDNTPTYFIENINTTYSPHNGDVISDLDINFIYRCSFVRIPENVSNTPLTLNLFVDGYSSPIQLFRINWSDLFIEDTQSLSDRQQIYIEYDSESGILYQKFGNGQYKILSLWNEDSNGYKILSTIEVRKLLIPGKFSSDITLNQLTFQLTGLNQEFLPNPTTSPDDNPVVSIEMFGRTNVI